MKNLRAILFVVLVAAAPASAGAGVITIDTIPGGGVDASRTVTAGDSFVVDVLLDDVVDMAGFQFDITFDPSKLTATGIVSGNVFGLDTLPIASSIGAGTLTFAETTLALSGLNVAAPIVLANLQFTAVSAGLSPLTLLGVVLSDSQGLPIDIVSLVDGQVIVTPQAVPEPATAVLALGGLAVALYQRRRRTTRDRQA